MIVFLHGVPETAAIWRKVQAAVGGESVALTLPGFGRPSPDGFEATKDEYAAWVLGELDRIEGPIDLVGHDWGALIAYRIVTAYGDGVRSWVADVGNGFHPDYAWHDFARTWQAPGEGETFFEAQLATPAQARSKVYEGMGLEPEDALELASGLDPAMAASILALYRSATPNAHSGWGPLAPTSAPGLVLHPSEDPFSNEQRASEVAEALGARFARIEGAGHFWPYQCPETVVPLLKSFWASLPA